MVRSPYSRSQDRLRVKPKIMVLTGKSQKFLIIQGTINSGLGKVCPISQSLTSTKMCISRGDSSGMSWKNKESKNSREPLLFLITYIQVTITAIFLPLFQVLFKANLINHLPVVPGFPKTFDVNLTRSGQWIEKCLGSEYVVAPLFTAGKYIQFKCDFALTPYKNFDESYFFQETFAASDQTDAILVVKDKKLHVNKQVSWISGSFLKFSR